MFLTTLNAGEPVTAGPPGEISRATRTIGP